jgi:putative phosphoribosyl transferase
MRDVDVPHELARLLAPLRGTAPLLLATTLDALPLARHLADALLGDLDALLVAPIVAPVVAPVVGSAGPGGDGGSERCLGWVDEHGHGYLKDAGRRSGPYLAMAACRTAARELADLRQRLSPGRAPWPVRDRVTVLVDDRPAERERLQACVDSLRRQLPELVVVAAVRARDAAAPALERVDFVACVPTRRMSVRPSIGEARVRDLLVR